MCKGLPNPNEMLLHTNTHTTKIRKYCNKWEAERDGIYLVLHGRMCTLCGFLGFRFSISAAKAAEEKEEQQCKSDLEFTFAQVGSYITSQAETHTHTQAHTQLHFGAKGIGKCKSFFAN